jgi:pimeloyl-ACP methyl ester carboxylesterase
MASESDNQAMYDAYEHRAEALSVERGSGPTVLFSHGHMMDRTMFAPQLDALSDDYHVVAYDHPARTDHWEGPYDLEDLIECCRHLIRGLGHDSVVLGGMSMGGYMAQEFAAKYPELVDALVLIDTTSEALSAEEQEEYSQAFSELQEAPTVPREFAEWLTDLLFGATTNEENPELVEHWVDRWTTYPGPAVHWEADSWVHRETFTDRLREVDVPALAVHGEEDQGIPPEAARPMVDALPDARFELIPEAGHTSNLENPEPVNAAVREFLDEVTA